MDIYMYRAECDQGTFSPSRFYNTPGPAKAYMNRVLKRHYNHGATWTVVRYKLVKC